MFLEPLASLCGKDQCYQLLWEGAQKISELKHCLERLGLLLGVKEWTEPIEKKMRRREIVDDEEEENEEESLFEVKLASMPISQFFLMPSVTIQLLLVFRRPFVMLQKS